MMSPLTSLSVFWVIRDRNASIGLPAPTLGPGGSTLAVAFVVLFAAVLFVVGGLEKEDACRGYGMGIDGDC